MNLGLEVGVGSSNPIMIRYTDLQTLESEAIRNLEIVHVAP